MDRSLYTKSILVGGAIAGILSAIPVVQAVNCCCCCLWVVMGGMIAAYVFVSDSPVTPRDADGALVGLGAGAVAGLIGSTVNTLLQLLTGPALSMEMIEPLLENVPSDFQDQIRMGMEMQNSPGQLISSMLIFIVVAMGMSALGGLIGVRLFLPLRMKMPPYPRPDQWGAYGRPMPPGAGYFPPGGQGPSGAPWPGPPASGPGGNFGVHPSAPPGAMPPASSPTPPGEGIARSAASERDGGSKEGDDGKNDGGSEGGPPAWGGG